ncbi:GNAT family N-acetyltransferase [Candidatus Woesearchaeota archaeon]|nr:GNAT family N-acetyltransferase [Candidatus Woesearchaeota archaeon]
MSLEIKIKHYNKQYRNVIRNLCCDTCFIGLPLENAFSDRKIFADIETKYYTDYEPESSLIVVDKNELAGYLLGCVNYNKYKIIKPLIYISSIIIGATKFILGYYKNKNFDIVNWFFKEGYLQIPKIPVDSAHFHITLDKKYREGGLGKRMVAIFEDNLIKHKIKRCYVQVYYSRESAFTFFKKLGYEHYDSKQFTGFRKFIKDEVRLCTLVKDLK